MGKVKGAEQVEWAGGFGQRRRLAGLLNPSWNMRSVASIMFREGQHAKHAQPRDDNIKDGTEDANHNGKIDGDNGDSIFTESEKWIETDPNSKDTDGDTFEDKDEYDWGYNPLSSDTDNDCIPDNEEDTSNYGEWDSETETKVTDRDTDGDGLNDNVEIDGWIVCVTHEATKEVMERYNVNSDPLDVDSDNDNVNDLDEYKNGTDPYKSDTDGDGFGDYFEMKIYSGSSPKEIDGIPPNITKLDSDYDIRYDKYSKLIPVGVDLEISITVRDDFGVRWVKIHIEDLADQKYYFDNQSIVSETYKYKIGAENANKLLFSGFDINITAMDRNSNLGYKEDELPGIANMVLSALLGALLAAVTFIAELVSGMFDWIFDAIETMMEKALEKIDEFISYIETFLKDFSNKFFRNGEEGISKMADKFLKLFDNPLMYILLGIDLTLTAVAFLINGIPIAGQVLLCISLVVGILITALMVVFKDEIEELTKSIIDIFINNLKGIIDKKYESTKSTPKWVTGAGVLSASLSLISTFAEILTRGLHGIIITVPDIVLLIVSILTAGVSLGLTIAQGTGVTELTPEIWLTGVLCFVTSMAVFAVNSIKMAKNAAIDSQTYGNIKKGIYIANLGSIIFGMVAFFYSLFQLLNGDVFGDGEIDVTKKDQPVQFGGANPDLFDYSVWLTICSYKHMTIEKDNHDVMDMYYTNDIEEKPDIALDLSVDNGNLIYPTKILKSNVNSEVKINDFNIKYVFRSNKELVPIHIDCYDEDTGDPKEDNCMDFIDIDPRGEYWTSSLIYDCNENKLYLYNRHKNGASSRVELEEYNNYEDGYKYYVLRGNDNSGHSGELFITIKTIYNV